MSRFEKFQNTKVLDKENNPINGQIFIYDSIINFENGFINNWYHETEGLNPAISCIDAHIEFWENGKLNNNNNPAVLSAGDDIIEFWEDGKKTDKSNYYPKNYNNEIKFKLGIKAENNFAKYLNNNEIPFIHLDQQDGELFSKIFKSKKLKRPDYIIFIDKKPLFVDVKATSCYRIGEDELKKINNLKNEYSIDVIFAVTKINSNNEKDNIDKIEFTYSFLTLENLTNYAELFKRENPNYKIFDISDSLIKDKIVFDKINNDDLSNMIKKENGDEYYYFSDKLTEYFKEEGYKLEIRA